MEVFEELEATGTVGGLEHGDVRMIAVEADRRVGPFPTHGVTTEEGESEVGEEGDRRLEVANGDADVLELDGHGVEATEPARSSRRTPREARIERWSGSRFATPRSTMPRRWGW
jgi:hypothetical protein